MKLEAMRHVSMDEIEEMMGALMSGDREKIKAYMSKYTGLSAEKQGALAYMESLIGAASFGFKSPYQEAAKAAFLYPERRQLKSPFAFCGWAGARNDLGPAYQINQPAFLSQDTELFYTDEDIENSRECADDLARQIEKESSGISHARAERLANFQVEDAPLGEKWGVVFALEASAVKEGVFLNSNFAAAGETGGFVFVLPKVGEFSCMLGHRCSNVCLILAKDMYCMK